MPSTCSPEQVPLCICNVHLVTDFLTSGLLQVAHKIHTLRVELYENAADYVRLTLEVLLTLGIGYTVFIECKAIFMTHMKTVSLLGDTNTHRRVACRMLQTVLLHSASTNLMRSCPL